MNRRAVLKTYRVLFTDYTQWEAHIRALSPEKAIAQADKRWGNGGTSGFLEHHRLDVVCEGCVTEDWRAEEVLS